MQSPFLKPIAIIETLEQAGYEAYYVGGSVRDLLLQRTIGDVDIATSARPEVIKKLFAKTIDVGIEHGTIIVLLDGESYEVTTFRAESEYVDYRRPSEVTFISSLEEDLKRRDFTMNAIAMTKSGKLLDPFGGQEDIKRKIIQTVGNPTERFSEDALRMMRALRFVSQLSFSLSPTTYEAIKQNRSLLENISIERITIEFMKLVKGENFKTALKLLSETNLHHYLPGLKDKGEILTALGEYELSLLIEESEYWTLLLWKLNELEDATLFLRAWKLSNKIIHDVVANLHFLEKRFRNQHLDWTDFELYLLGKRHLEQVERVYYILQHKNPTNYIEHALRRYDALPIKSRADLAVNGHDLMKWTNQKGGPWLKEWMEKIEQLVVEKKLANDNDSIKEWIASCNLK